MNQWDIKATRDLVLRQGGKAQFLRASPPLRSLIERQEYAAFHYFEIKSLFADFVKAQLQDRSLLEAVFSEDVEDNDKHNRFHTQVGAHVIGCVQSLHAVADIAAHAIYFSLSLDMAAEPLPEQVLGFRPVLKLLEQDTALLTVAKKLAALEGGKFLQLTALANHCKHRSIVRIDLHEDQTGVAKQKHELRFQSFEYKGNTYYETEVVPFLQCEFDRINRAVVDLGVSIHESLLAREA